MIGRVHHMIIDCPEPRALAEFYAELLGLPITYADDDFTVVSEDDHHSGVAFQRVRDHRPPQWPDPAYPQQIHLDVMVDDLDMAATAVLVAGATRLHAPDEGHVFADPAGHPFCLIVRPDWAPPVDPLPDQA